MTLANLRKLSIKKQCRVHFKLRNGLECIVNEHGVATVPGLNRIPDFNLEEELASAAEFLLDPVPPPDSKANSKPLDRPRKIGRQELSALTEGAGHAAAAAVEHDDE